MPLLRCCALLLFLLLAGRHPATAQADEPAADEPAYLLIRSDDLGMSHAKNMANLQLMETGLPLSASVMFPTPWYQEAVELLKAHPEVSVGIHLTLNSEWKYLRWGPVLGQAAVPSLVDSAGVFFSNGATFWAEPPVLSEVERELRAQIERALQTGLRIDYVDAHMGTATANDDMRAITEKLAAEYGLGISSYFDEQRPRGAFGQVIEAKQDRLLETLASLEPGSVNLIVTHLGLETPEMNVLADMNRDGATDVAAARHAELQALLSPEFREALDTHNIRLITYRDLIDRKGLASMQRPSN